MPVILPNRQTFKYPLSAGSGASFTPAQLPSLVIWLDPSNVASVTVNANKVAQINDLSGNGNHFSQGAAGNRPDYTATLNALNIMGFVAANNDNLVCVNSVLHGPSITVASVHQASSAVGAVRGIYAADNGGANRVVQHRWDSNTVPTTVSFPGGVPTNVSGAGAPDITLAAHTFISICDDSAHTVNNFIDGTNNGSASGLAALTSSSLAWNVGRATVGGANFWDGPIAEVVVCNAALNASQRGALQSYLKGKWGTP